MVRFPGSEEMSYICPKRFETCSFLICLLTLISSLYRSFLYNDQITLDRIIAEGGNILELHLEKHC